MIDRLKRKVIIFGLTRVLMGGLISWTFAGITWGIQWFFNIGGITCTEQMLHSRHRI